MTQVLNIQWQNLIPPLFPIKFGNLHYGGATVFPPRVPPTSQKSTVQEIVGPI